MQPAPQPAAPPERLGIEPIASPGNDSSITVSWRAVELGSNRSFGCTVTAADGQVLTVTVDQGPYQRTLQGQGTVSITAIPVAPEGTLGRLVVRLEAKGSSAEFAWQWRPLGAPVVPTRAPSAPRGFWQKLFRGRGKSAAPPTPAKLPSAARVSTVAERLGTRAALAVSLKFFGQEAVGHRFAFILDRSGSMQGKRWEACTRQLERALRALPEHVEFIVILFATTMSEPTVATREGWLPAERDKVDAVISWVNRLSPSGGTYPAEAFQRVFSLADPPDVIYFLTDGELAGFSALDFEQLLGDKPTIVNTIALEGDAEVGVLQEIAAASGGQFILIPDASSGGL